MAPNKAVLTKNLTESFVEFLDAHPPEPLSSNLIKLVLEFIASKKEMDFPYIEDLVYDLQGLFDLLETAEKEWSRKEP